MTDSEKELVTSLRNRAENALQEGTATAQADAWHFTQSADAIETLLAERAAAWVSKCFICDDVDAPREKCLCVSCHVGRERKRAETAERERDEARAFIEGLEYSDDPEVKYGARMFMDKVRTGGQA